MKENFSNLLKERDMRVQEAQSVPNKMDAKRPMPRHIIIKMPKVKDKERILKAAIEKQLVTYRGVFIKMSADFSKEILQENLNGLAKNIQSHEKQGPTSKFALPSKDIIQNQKADKELPRQEKKNQNYE